MESSQREFEAKLFPPAPGAAHSAAVPSRHASSPPADTSSRPVLPETEAPARIRLNLQQRAPSNLRRHALRELRRVGVLVIADLTSFYVMRELWRVMHGAALLSGRLSGGIDSVLPRGILNGWQYAAALFVALLVTGNYGQGNRRRDPQRLFLGSALATALPLWMTIWTRGLGPMVVQYVITTGLVWAGLVAERRVIDRIVARLLPYSRQAAATLFVGTAEDCRAAMASPAFSNVREYRAVGFVDIRVPPAADSIGHVVDFPKLLHQAGTEVVAVCGYVSDSRFRDIVDAALASQCLVLSVPRTMEIAGVQPSLVWRGGQPVIELTAPSLKSWQMFVKRVLDVVGAAAGLVLTTPITAVIAAVIKLESRGPVLFTQERIGRGGRRFRILKFRTMVDGSEHRRDELLSRSVYDDQRLFKVRNDPRMTRVGRWLRRTSLDELPQLLNVLRGEMSLVGPRPPLPSEVELYQARHYTRFDVKPGMTGPWQVAGRNCVASFEEVIAVEANYIRTWSVWTDISLLLKTIPAVIRMQGAF